MELGSQISAHSHSSFFLSLCLCYIKSSMEEVFAKSHGLWSPLSLSSTEMPGDWRPLRNCFLCVQDGKEMGGQVGT